MTKYTPNDSNKGYGIIDSDIERMRVLQRPHSTL